MNLSHNIKYVKYKTNESIIYINCLNIKTDYTIDCQCLATPYKQYICQNNNNFEGQWELESSIWRGYSPGGIPDLPCPEEPGKPIWSFLQHTRGVGEDGRPTAQVLGHPIDLSVLLVCVLTVISYHISAPLGQLPRKERQSLEEAKLF